MGVARVEQRKIRRSVVSAVALAVSFGLLATGCDDGKPGMEGIVVREEGGRILVVDPKPRNVGLSGGEAYYDAAWFSGAPRRTKVGHRVQVWFEVMAASYPGQATAKKVRILRDETPRGADRSEAEAIREALRSVDGGGLPIVTSAEYDPEADAWRVAVKRERDEMTITVIDE